MKKIISLAVFLASGVAANAAPTYFGGTGSAARWFEIVNMGGNKTKSEALSFATGRAPQSNTGARGFLGQINNQSVQGFGTNLATSGGFNSVVGTMWISGTDAVVQNTWRFNAGGQFGGQAMTYTNFASGEPNGGSGENDITIEMSNYSTVAFGKWVDMSSAGAGGNTRLILVEYNAIPVPASMPLIATGLGALAFFARRKAKKNA